MPKYLDKAISDEILEKLKLKNRYAFVNNNLSAILKPEQFNFFRNVQKFCMRFEKKNDIQHSLDEDIYGWVPEFGKEGLVTRLHNLQEIDINYETYGLAPDLLRAIAVDMFDPSFDMIMGATTLAINPVKFHHEGRPECLKALKDLATGESAGAILITEPERGSDAVHLLSESIQNEDGSFTLNGEKIYNTNAPKANWVVGYACAEKSNGKTMGQFLINTKWEGFNVQRVYIPWVPKIWIGHEHLENLNVPSNYVLGGIGKGRDHLFEGLVPERVMIALGNCGQAWGALSHAFLFINMRRQFNQEILKFQGVGFTFADLWARVTNFTLALLKFCEEYDAKVEKFGGELPANINQAMVASSSHLKLEGSRISERTCYECANLMGGAGVNDNTLMSDLLGISRIQEIVGGTRQIQQYILSMATRQLWKMV